MPYNKIKFRAIRHGIDSQSAYCRNCQNSKFDTAKEGIAHAKKTGHTVDVYRENWTEYTSYVKPTKSI